MNAAVSITGRAPGAARRWALHTMIFVNCALAAGCGTRQAPAVQAAPSSQPAPESDPEETESEAEAAPPAAADQELTPATTPEEVAQRWLEALRRESSALLGEWSRYPFVMHDTGTEGTCGHGAAADPAQLARLLTCLLSNRMLLDELRAHPLVPATPLKAKDLPAWARRWRAELTEETTPVLVEVAGHAASHFVLVVFDGGVSALWKETVFQQ